MDAGPERLVRLFAEHFGGVGLRPPRPSDLWGPLGRPDSGGRLWRARGPGRVNLIGEHTDYNDGFVLPMALEQEVTLIGRRGGDGLVHLWAESFAEPAVFPVRELSPKMEPTWARYLAGVIWALGEAGVEVPGFQAVVAADLPVGAGLSSSAAVEVATALLALSLASAEMPRKDLAKLCRRAENEFVGVRCGIMDQFASLFGSADHAVFLDCRSLEHELVPIDSGAVSLLVLDTRVRHELGATEYHKRQEECREAVCELSRLLGPRTNLRDVSPEEFARVESRLAELLRRRARHVITENARVLASVEALRSADVERFGLLMDASHESLRADYEVSCAELDALVGLARRQEGCLGARMTGGGFGGAVVALVRTGREEAVARAALEGYRRETGREGRWLLSRPAGGGSAEVLAEAAG
jgi:galactokinase